MGRIIIVVGDPTDHGGVVISGSGQHKIDGKGIARLGDQVRCPLKGHGVNAIVEGEPSCLIDGVPVALEGHKTACGCSLIGTRSATHGGSGSSISPAVSAIRPGAGVQDLLGDSASTRTLVSGNSLAGAPSAGNSQRVRNIYAAADGVMEVVGWESPTNHRHGYGFRLKQRIAGDKSLFVYAHIDPATVQVAPGQSVSTGQQLGEYADPTNGGSTGPHLHLEWWNASGERLDPEAFLNTVMPGHVKKDAIRFRGTHPVTGRPKMHNGYDLVGPWST